MIKAFNTASQICTSSYIDAVADEHDAERLTDCDGACESAVICLKIQDIRAKKALVWVYSMSYIYRISQARVLSFFLISAWLQMWCKQQVHTVLDTISIVCFSQT